MASKLIAAQHTYEGLLKFVLPDDTVTADLEVMTMTGAHVYRKDRNSVEKCFFPWSKENTPPPKFKKSKGDTRTKEFLGSLLNQDLEPNFWTKSPCKCPIFSKLARTHKVPKPSSSQAKHYTNPDNIPVTGGLMQAQKLPRKQQMQKKIKMRSDWSDSDDDKDSQARGKPIIHDISSDQETDTNQQTTVATPLRRPNMWPKVLTCGRGRGKFPYANWTSVAKGHGHNDGCDISEAPPSLNNQDPNVERNSVVIVPIDRV